MHLGVCIIFVAELVGEGSEPTVITVPVVMEQIAEIGYGNIPAHGWEHLVRFRQFLPTPIAEMLLNCLFHVVNGRVRSATENFAR